MEATVPPATGNHECLVVTHAEDAQQRLVDWVKTGLQGGALLVHVEAEEQEGTLARLLASHRIGVAGLERSGQLNVVSPDAAYLVNGSFDPPQRYATDRRFVEDALRDGWPSVRLSGEAVDALPYRGVQGLLALEGNAEQLSRRYPVDCLCVERPAQVR